MRRLIEPGPNETQAERLARLRALYTYRRALGIVAYRDPMTLGERTRWLTRHLAKVQRAKLALLPPPDRLPANVVRLPRVRR